MSLRNIYRSFNILFLIGIGLASPPSLGADIVPGPFQLPSEWQERNPWRPLPQREVIRRAPDPVPVPAPDQGSHEREPVPYGSEHLNATREVQSDAREIIELATSILRGKNARAGDLDRARALHDWVARNIRYDVPALDSGSYVSMRTDAIATLSTRLTVCQGYATLLGALLRAAGIPARLVDGYATSDTYSQAQSSRALAEKEESNALHAWVEAYVGGRWVTMDPTWNSGYVEGTKGTRSRRFVPSFRRDYFNPKADLLNRTHRRRGVQDVSQY